MRANPPRVLVQLLCGALACIALSLAVSSFGGKDPEGRDLAAAAICLLFGIFASGFGVLLSPAEDRKSAALWMYGLGGLVLILVPLFFRFSKALGCPRNTRDVGVRSAI